MKKKISNIIFNIILIACPVLLFVFMSQPYLTIKTVLGTADAGMGYDYISFEGNGTLDTNAIFMILTCVFAGILILASLYSLFKGEKTGKIVEFIKLVSVLVLVVSTIVSVACLSSQCNKLIVLGWAGIVNIIVAVVALISYLLSKLKFFNKK